MSEHDEPEKREIEKLLRDLPRVKASADFEQRLARRLGDDASRPRLLPSWLAPEGHIPAPVYSAAIVAVLGIASYFAFFRSGALPVDQKPTGDLVTRTETSIPQPKDENMRDQSTATKADRVPESRVAEGKGTRSIGEMEESGGKAKVAPEQHLSNVPSPAESRQKEELAKKALPAAQGRQNEMTTQEAAQGISKTRLNNVGEEGLLQESLRQISAPPVAPMMRVAPGQKEFSRDAKAMETAVQAAAFQVAVDSIHIKDSLRADSLRKAKIDSLKKH